MKTISDYTIHCTEEQTKRAYKLGAPINKVFEALAEHSVYIEENGKVFYLEIPTTRQIRRWLDEEKHINFAVVKLLLFILIFFNIASRFNLANSLSSFLRASSRADFTSSPKLITAFL